MAQRNITGMTIARRLLPAALLVAVLLVSGCGGGADSNTAQSRDVSCLTAPASLEQIPRYVSATGSLKAEKSVTVSTRMMGWVRSVHVSEGQVVSKGDKLISIDDTDLIAKKAQAEAGINEASAVLANAQQMYERFEKLYADKSVSKQQLDDVRTGRDRAAAGLEMARAGLREVNVHLSYLEIVSPIDGLVSRKMIEEGNMANPGMPLLMLEQSGRMKVVAHLGEKDVSSVKVGDLAEVNVTSLTGAVYNVPVDNVVQAANPGSRTYDVEAHIDNTAGRLRSGMFARVNLPVGHREAVLVPSAAVIERGQLTGVWIVDDQNLAHLRWVRLGHAYGDRHEVLSGMTGDETVVLNSAMPLVEGDKVVN